MRILIIGLLLNFCQGGRDDIVCYKCRHEIYDGVPEGDDNCDILTEESAKYQLRLNFQISGAAIVLYSFV